MDFVNYLFASFISFLGIAAGIALIKIAPEERKPLKNHFEKARKIVLMAIFAFIAFYFRSSSFYLMVLAAYALLAVFIELKIKDIMRKSMMIYGLLGIVFFLSSKAQELFLIEASLIFIYGAISASFLYNKKESNIKKIIFSNFIFIIMSASLYFI